MASLLKWVAYSSVHPSTAIPECTMAWRTEGSMRAFAPHSHACPLKSLAQPDGKEGRDLFQESNPRAAKVWKMLISPLCQWVSKQSLFSKINWIHKKYCPQQTSSGLQITHQAIQNSLHATPADSPNSYMSLWVKSQSKILTLLIGKATGKNITRSTRTTGVIAAPTANPNLEQIAWGAI
jgi:hypothetical protein